jgi:hypothetical protein
VIGTGSIAHHIPTTSFFVIQVVILQTVSFWNSLGAPSLQLSEFLRFLGLLHHKIAVSLMHLEHIWEQP